MQAAAWMMIIWHTVMPCSVFIGAYWKIFVTIRRQLKISQQPAPASAVAQRDAEARNVDGQSGLKCGNPSHY